MIDFNLDDIIGCTGIEIKPDATLLLASLMQVRPEQDPIPSKYQGRYNNETEEQAAARCKIEQKRHFNRNQLQAQRVEIFLAKNDGDGFYYLYVVGPKTKSTKSLTGKDLFSKFLREHGMNIRPTDLILFNLLANISGTITYKSNKNHIVAQIPVNPLLMAQIPLYEVPEKK